MNKFGHRVIGRQAAKQAQEIEKARAQHFGPRVIGQIFQRRKDIAAAEEKDTRSNPATKLAKREAAKQDPAVAAEQRGDAAAKQETIEAPITANLQELEHALANSPAMYERLFESEKLRAEGPRKMALRLFLAHEMEHEDREERKNEIEELLKGL